MINIKDEKVRELSESLHEKILRKARQAGDVNEKFVLENRIFNILCDDPGVPPAKCAIRLNDKYGYELSGDDVIQIFRSRRMAFPKERIELFEWALQVAELFASAASGDRNSFDAFNNKRKETAVKSIKHHDSQDRICVLMIARICPELFYNEDYELIDNFGNALGKYLFYDMADIIGEVYGFPTYRDSKNNVHTKKVKPSITLEQAINKINILESELERTSSMLSDLQKEFSEQLEESKVKELTDFFSRLNSEKYGCILDQLLELQKGVNNLRKNGFEVPIEINGILIVVKKLIQFIKDSHIDPMMKPDSEKDVKASDIEFCDYIGTPFVSETEIKKIKTLSPGWIFRDKSIQISRPRVEEVK